MVVFDANFLIFFLDSKIRSGVGANPKVDYLVQRLQMDGERILVPTPALCELLVGAGDAAPRYLDILNRSRHFRIEPFDQRASVELAAVIRDAKAEGSKRGPTPEASWQKVNFDRQIVAIAKVNGATAIYSIDADVAAHGKASGITVINLDELPEPPTPPQIEMILQQSEPEPPPSSEDD